MPEDRELKEFRSLMTPPETYEEGFGWRTVIMALFVGLLLAPAQLYMQLVAGVEMGAAAQWVTVILYVEICRRAFVTLKRPEIFVLFYMCGAVINSSGGLLWQQFVVQSEELRRMGITEFIPAWYAPGNPEVLSMRSFFMKQWLVPVGLVLLTMFLTRLDNFGLGYIMFRLTSDVEKLPFPMAPVGAMGMTALADTSQQKDTWRWRTFAFGGMAGMVFGFIYLAIPNITGALFSEPIRILPLPFVDLTTYTQNILPATPMMISFDLTFVVLGMVLPFWAMMGSFIGVVFVSVLNPILQHTGVLHSWMPGSPGIQTIQSNVMDFYFSFSLGLGLAVAVIGIANVLMGYRATRREQGEKKSSGPDWRNLFRPPAGRGDIPIWVALIFYLFSTCTYMTVAYYLVNYASGPLHGSKFPLWLLAFYGFVYNPVISYISGRMEGIVGQQVSVPFVREASFILSGYKGAAIWFAPIPLQDYSRQALFFKTTELTGCKFTSIIKSELLIFPIIAVAMIFFSQFIWSIDHVPSQMFPYANQFWELRAYQQGLIYSATLPGEAASPFREAFRPEFLAIGFVLAISVYSILNHFSLPIFLVYGVIRSLDQSAPHVIIPMFIGALLGRFFFRKKFGDKWPQYRIVFSAGFAAGVGLITMLSLGIVLMTKSAIKLPL
jgi:hypothetical protein